MMSVKEILARKGCNVFTISSNASVFEALKLMSEKDIGALIVKDGEKVAGILSERDYARKVILEGKSSKDLGVTEIMSPDVIFINSSISPEECMAMMTEKRIRYLPVFEDNKLSGIISIGDVVGAIMEQKKYLIDQLEEYITVRR